MIRSRLERIFYVKSHIVRMPWKEADHQAVNVEAPQNSDNIVMQIARYLANTKRQFQYLKLPIAAKFTEFWSERQAL